jgi:hypothetical protein
MEPYHIDRRCKFIEFEQYEYDPDSLVPYEPIENVGWGFCIGTTVHSGRYPEFSCDFELITYIIMADDGRIVRIYEDFVEFMGWKRPVHKIRNELVAA